MVPLNVQPSIKLPLRLFDTSVLLSDWSTTTVQHRTQHQYWTIGCVGGVAWYHNMVWLQGSEVQIPLMAFLWVCLYKIIECVENNKTDRSLCYGNLSKNRLCVQSYTSLGGILTKVPQDFESNSTHSNIELTHHLNHFNLLNYVILSKTFTQCIWYQKHFDLQASTSHYSPRLTSW